MQEIIEINGKTIPHLKIEITEAMDVEAVLKQALKQML